MPTTVRKASWHILLGEDACLRNHEAVMPFASASAVDSEAEAKRLLELAKRGQRPACGDDHRPLALPWTWVRILAKLTCPLTPDTAHSLNLLHFYVCGI